MLANLRKEAKGKEYYSFLGSWVTLRQGTRLSIPGFPPFVFWQELSV